MFGKRRQTKEDPFEGGFQAGVKFADHYMQSIMDLGATPYPWPVAPADVPRFVDEMTPSAMDVFNEGMQASTSRPMAVPLAVLQGVEQGFRTRFHALVLKSLGA